MDRREIIKYIAGYIFGGSFFLLIIPGILYCIARLSSAVFPYTIFSDERIGIIISSIILIPGLVFMIWSNAALFFKGKGGPAEGFGIEISPRTKFLVTTGPYRYTRNPMVFGAYSMYLALTLFLNSYVSLTLLVILLPVIIMYLERSEEKRLVKDFGEDFKQYRERVSMLIPLPPKK